MIPEELYDLREKVADFPCLTQEEKKLQDEILDAINEILEEVELDAKGYTAVYDIHPNNQRISLVTECANDDQAFAFIQGADLAKYDILVAVRDSTVLYVSK